jgi:hypothetical protein
VRPNVIRAVIALLIYAGTSGLVQSQQIPSPAAAQVPYAAPTHRQVVLRPLQLIHQVTPSNRQSCRARPKKSATPTDHPSPSSRVVGTLPWLRFDRSQPSRWFRRGKYRRTN